MRIIKLTLSIVWIFAIISMSIYLLIQSQDGKIQKKEIQNLLYKSLPNAELCNEYYSNIKELRKHPETKTIADSIFNDSDFLKRYETSYLKNNKE
ncbi:MAG: hypothetical protein H6537_10540 [Bacteroidales bacterium]|nr:hypothetical protein [Bacteroidales bacterium]